MDRVYLAPGLLADGRIVVTGAERRHLADALRVRVGDEFLATDGQGMEYELVAERVDRRELEAVVRAERRVPPPRGHAVTLALAPPKGSRMETAVEKTVECGVGRIVPLRTERSVVRPADGSERTERWRRVARSALAQSGGAWLPPILDSHGWSEALALDGRSYVAHLDPEAAPLSAALADVRVGDPVTVLIGPEGGFSDAEIEESRRAGAIAVSLGDTKLRTETAAIVAVALAVAALRPAD